MTSLKNRLLVVLFIVAAFFWAALLVLLVVFTTRQETGQWDGLFQMVAVQILESVPAQIAQLPKAAVQSPQRPEKLSFQIWVNRERCVVCSAGSPTSPLRDDFVDGFSNHVIGSDRWRVYSISSSLKNVQVQVGAPQRSIENELLRKVAAIIAGALLLLALLGTAIWWVVRWSLRPAEAIEAALKEKEIFDLTPLPVENLPIEVRRLVVAFNALLARLDQAVEGERRFIADAAHELRTPLAALQAHVQVALRASDSAEKHAALAKLLAAAERSARLAEQFLDMAKLDTVGGVPHQSIDLCVLLPIVVRDFEATARQRQQVISIDSQSCLIEGDVDELGILTRNLLDNALRYSHESGRVVVACGQVERDGKLYGFLRVADDGPGVPEGLRQLIFDRFYRVPGSGNRGSGIGLSLVARIVESHGAQIEAGEGLAGRGLGMTVLFRES